MRKKLISFLLAGCICISSAAMPAAVQTSQAYKQLIASLRGISVHKNPIAVGESIKLELEWTNGAVPEMKYSSDNENVAVVDGDGVITGVSEGSAVITATRKDFDFSKTITINVSGKIQKSTTYNTSELSLGAKLKKYDILHYDGKSKGGYANIVNTRGDYDVVHINNKDYVMPFDAELVGIDGLAFYLAPENDEINYLDGRGIEVGDIIPPDTHLLCYDYVINRNVLPVFLPRYYEQIVGEGIIKVHDIDHDKKTITLKAVPFSAGDLNGDGGFSVSDILLFQKWLVSDEKGTKSYNIESADFNKDGILDVFDFIEMRKALVNGLKTTITRDDIINISKKGYDIKVSDFDKFKGENIGSDVCVMKYNIEGVSKEVGYLLVVSDGKSNIPTDVTVVNVATNEKIDIRSEEWQHFINKPFDYVYEAEDNEETRADAKILGKYALEKLRDGTYSLFTVIKEPADIDDEEVSLLFDRRFAEISFLDEHIVHILLSGGFIESYGYLVTDGSVKFEEYTDVSIPKKGYDGDSVYIDWAGNDIYHFYTGI